MTIDNEHAEMLGPATHAAAQLDHEVRWLAYTRSLFDGGSHPTRRRLEPAKSFGQLPVQCSSSTWLIEGLFPQQGVAIIAGVPKSSKSWLALDAALAVASGQPFLNGRRVMQGPVLYIPLEDQEEDIRKRLFALGAARGLTPEAIELLPLWICGGSGLDLVDPNTLHEAVARGLLALHGRYQQVVPSRFALIVVDPLRDAHTANEDNSTDMRPVLGTLRALHRAVGGLVVVTHHLSKGSGRNGGSLWDRLRGSGAIHGSLDAGIFLDDAEAPEPDRLTATMNTTLRARRRAPPLAVTLNIRDEQDGAVYARWSEEPVVGGRGAKDRARDMDAIRADLQAHPEGKAVSALREVIRGSHGRVLQAVDALVHAGDAVLEKTGRSSIVRLAAPPSVMGNEGPLPSPQ